MIRICSHKNFGNCNAIYRLKNLLFYTSCKSFSSINLKLPSLLFTFRKQPNCTHIISVYDGVSFKLINMSLSTEASTSTGAGALKSNKLVLEKSPYLLQHAFNPVEWYPWGQEAFDKAKKENKIIFLSVGYSTCHWCHVMEKESFENASVAEVMNKHYVCVKVDREERPDVDKMYMSFIQRTIGGGGWPMSVFLTPDLEPLFGGTYFPPEDKYGRVGFKSILTLIAKQWSEQHTILNTEAKSSITALKRVTAFKLASRDDVQIPGTECARKCLSQFSKSYESEYGGFSTAPKFPQPSIFDFMFHMYSKNKTSEHGKECLEMSLHTLRRMAYGGIHDHVNMGFARYSVDGKWHVPHFEKMLYDQGQLAMAYADAYVITKDDFFSDIIKDILNYVSRDLSHELGGFYGAEDADSYPFEGAPHKTEGAFCVWEYDEINNLLDYKTDDISHAEVFCYHYNVKKGGNVNPGNDPHGELKYKNVLAAFGTYEDTSSKFKITIPQLKLILQQCHKILYDERQKRPKPHVDTKIVTSWNGLMISGFAKGAFALHDQNSLNRAILAANFIKKYLYDPESKTLLRCCYRGDDGGVSQIGSPISGFVDDYAFLIRGIVDLYEASLDSEWLEWAEILQDQQDKLFWDATNSAYFTSPEGDASILIRDKEVPGSTPCTSTTAPNVSDKDCPFLIEEALDYTYGSNFLGVYTDGICDIDSCIEKTSNIYSYIVSSPVQGNSTENIAEVKAFLGSRYFSTTSGSRNDGSLHPIKKPPDFTYENGFVIVYTDGACENNGLPEAKAGIGIWFGDNHPCNVSAPVKGKATNNVAEIQASIRAVKIALENDIKKLCIKTDSQFVISSMTIWIKKWQKNGWKLSTGGYVKNRVDFRKLSDLCQKLDDVRWIHVASHQGIEGNEEADRLARGGILQYKR